jgi:4'-phosphopantetheinyl transferase EntD
MSKSAGLGDDIEKLLKKMKADKLAKLIIPNCDCEKRKKKLNELVPYKNASR